MELTIEQIIMLGELQKELLNKAGDIIPDSKIMAVDPTKIKDILESIVLIDKILGEN